MQHNRLVKVALLLWAVLFVKAKLIYYIPFYKQFEIVLYQPRYMMVVQMVGIAVLYYLTAATYKPKASQWIRFVISGILGSLLWCLVAFGLGELQVWINSYPLPMLLYSWSSTIHILISAIYSTGILFMVSAAIAQWPWPKRSEQKRKQMRLIWLAFFAVSVWLVRLYQSTGYPGAFLWNYQTEFYTLTVLFLPLLMVALIAYTLSPEPREQMEHLDKETE